MADMGGLVANGEGTAAGNPKAELADPRLNPRFGRLGLVAPPGAALVLAAGGPGVAGAVPLLNSAHRGHFRLVSNMCNVSNFTRCMR